MTNTHSRIDWNSVRARLERAQAQERAPADREERLANVLRARAERLANRGRASTCGLERTRFVVCRIGSERFAFELARVSQILPMLPITGVPGKCKEILGIANVDGTLRSIADLAALVNLPSQATVAGYIIVLRSGERLLGVVVEAVDGIRHVGSDSLTAADQAASESIRNMSIGVTDDHVVVLDAVRLIEQVAVLTKAGGKQKRGSHLVM